MPFFGRQVFDTLLVAKVLIDRWPRSYNAVRPHSSLGDRPPGLGVAPPLSARFGYASASGQG
jgi:putative transposase